MVQHHWLRRGNWAPDNWALNLAVLKDGRVVGLQEINARDFAVLRQVSTASWLGVRHQGQGIGTEMRAAVLHLAFVGLGALEALSGAFGGQPHLLRRVQEAGLRTRRRRAVRHPRPARDDAAPALPHARRRHATAGSTTVTGLAPCLPLFGLPGEAAL